MKPSIFFVLAMGIALLAGGCSSHEPNLRLSGANMLDQS